MAADFSSTAVSAQSPPSAVLKQGPVPHHLLVTPSASKLKCLAEPKLRNLHRLHRVQRTAPLIPLKAEDTDNLLSYPSLLHSDHEEAGPIHSFSFYSQRHQQRQESSERDEFYANMGSAIRTIRDETPVLFYKDLNYSIYRDDITFRDPRNTFSGLKKYKLIFWALRFHGQMFFKAIWVEIGRIWQPSDGIIVVRWTVRGIPRVPWKAQGLFEGTSEYKLDKTGMIYEHKVDNVVPSNPWYLKTPALKDLLPPVPCPTPTPTFFDRVVLFVWTSLLVAEFSSWERLLFYLFLTSGVRRSAQLFAWLLGLGAYRAQ